MVEQWTENPCVSGSIPLLDKINWLTFSLFSKKHFNLLLIKMNFNTIKFLIKLKNAALARKEIVTAPYNKLSFDLVKCLYKEGFVQSFELSEINAVENEKKYEIKIVLRFFFYKCLLKNIKILSTPSLTKYFTLKDVSKISTKKLVLFFSTNKGILTSLDCKKHGLGGTLLFAC